MGEPVPERVDSGYFDLPPLADAPRGGRNTGLAPLPAPGGDQRRSDPPMDFDIPLGDAPSPAWGEPGSRRPELASSRGTAARDSDVDVPFDIDLPLARDGLDGPAGVGAGASSTSGQRGRTEPTDFNLDLMELAPMDRSGADKGSSISPLDIDLPITPAAPPAPGRR
jgi:hypothetical protein